MTAVQAAFSGHGECQSTWPSARTLSHSWRQLSELFVAKMISESAKNGGEVPNVHGIEAAGHPIRKHRAQRMLLATLCAVAALERRLI